MLNVPLEVPKQQGIIKRLEAAEMGSHQVW